jgi:hypothetical protein
MIIYHRRENSDPSKLKRLNIIENSNIDIGELQGAVNTPDDDDDDDDDNDDDDDENNQIDNENGNYNAVPTSELTGVAIPKKPVRPVDGGSVETLSTSPRGQFLRNYNYAHPNATSPNQNSSNPNININNNNNNGANPQNSSSAIITKSL